MRIIVLDGNTVNPGDNPWTPLEQFGSVEIFARTSAEDVIARAADAEILVVNKIRMSADVFGQLPKLRLVAVTATGYDCVDLDAARRHEVAVCNVPEYSTDSVAQFVFSLLLHLVHNVSVHAQLVRAGEWQRCGDFCFWRTPLVELSGLTIGIVGWGRIGQRVGTLSSRLWDEYPGLQPQPARCSGLCRLCLARSAVVVCRGGCGFTALSVDCGHGRHGQR